MLLKPIEMDWDEEWLELIIQAKQIGLTLEEVREYLGVHLTKE